MHARDAPSVLVADEDPLARLAIASALRADGIPVAGEAVTGTEALQFAFKVAPEVVLLDAAIRHCEAIPVLRFLAQRLPAVKTVILANRHDQVYALRCLKSGASGFLSKDIETEALANVVRGVARGEAAISRTMTMALIDVMRAPPRPEIGTRPVRSLLTPREWEVLDQLCIGESTIGIATRLCVSTETVRSHIKRILNKLEVSTRADAVKAAAQLRQPRANDLFVRRG